MTVTVTYLEMNDPAEIRPRRSTDPRFVVHEVHFSQGQLNRFLYYLVGEDWEWVDKHPWTEQQWEDYAAAETLRTFVAFLGDDIAGYYELSRDEAHHVEIVHFGLAPGFIGRGLGGVLLTDALERAWAWEARRVWLHTCTLDHPAAVLNYQARGMTVYDRETQEAE